MTEEYEQFKTAVDEPAEGAHQQLAILVKHMNVAAREVEQAEVNLKRAQENHRDICERQIPELMDSIGLAEFKTVDGMHIEIQRKIRASVPASRRAEAYDWLEKHGYGAMIKRTVSVAFNKDEESAAEELENSLAGQFAGVRKDMKVEPSTLSAFVREQLEAGSDLPLDLFGVYEQRVAKAK